MAKILVIDDEKEICREFQDIMEDDGHSVKSATSGKQGLQLIEKEKFDLVFLDVLMPGMEGREVFEEIRKISDVPVIIMSGYMPPQTEQAVVNLGARACLRKPLDLGEVRKLVASLGAGDNAAGKSTS